jgi:hypothetical protein
MANIDSINRILPATGTEALCVASITCRSSRRNLFLSMPPAGWNEPVVVVADMIRFVLDETSYQSQDNAATAEVDAKAWLATIPALERPVMVCDWAGQGACAAVSAVARMMSQYGDRQAQLAGRIRDFAKTLVDLPLIEAFDEEGRMGSRFSIRDFSGGPAPGGYTEAFWLACNEVARTVDVECTFEEIVVLWTQTFASQIEALQNALGRSVIDQDPDEAAYDWVIHRYVALHFMLWVAPEGEMSRFLLEVSAASTIEDLQEALLDPEVHRRSKPMWRFDPEYEFEEVTIMVGQLLEDYIP